MGPSTSYSAEDRRGNVATIGLIPAIPMLLDGRRRICPVGSASPTRGRRPTVKSQRPTPILTSTARSESSMAIRSRRWGRICLPPKKRGEVMRPAPGRSYDRSRPGQLCRHCGHHLLLGENLREANHVVQVSPRKAQPVLGTQGPRECGNDPLASRAAPDPCSPRPPRGGGCH